MTTAHEVAPLILGDLSFAVNTRLQKRLFGRPKPIPSVVVTLPGHRVEFDANSLLLLHGQTLLAELSAAQQSDLIVWLKSQF